jgi:hypothetical protein
VSLLKTYDRHPGDWVAAVDRKADEPLPELEPGIWVEVPGRGGYGIVVACNQENITVLWSQEPYVPQQAPVVFTPDDFKPRKGIMTRYSVKKVRPDYFGTINVTDVKDTK